MFNNMKKSSVFIALLSVLWFQSCKEIGPAIDFGEVGEDTAYTTAPETPQTRKMLAEEFTGVSCPPCPAGHAAMRSITASQNNNMIIIAYHILNYAQANPVEKDGQMLSKYDFRTQDATDVANSVLGGLGGMPEAAFDRTLFENKHLAARTKWAGAAQARAAAQTTTPVNIHITSTYDATTLEATVRVKLAYTDMVNFKQTLTLAVIEDSIIDAQKYEDTIIKNYVHEHVLRDIVTPVTGVLIPTKVDPKVAGRVYERTFKVPVKPEWHAEHCKLVVFVSNDETNNRDVVHTEEAHLIQ